MSRELLTYVPPSASASSVRIVFIAVSVNFIIPCPPPWDPVETALARLQSSGGAQNVDVQAVAAAYRSKYGLDQPLLAQYVKYWQDLLRLDLGVSFTNFPEKVSAEIAECTAVDGWDFSLRRPPSPSPSARCSAGCSPPSAHRAQRAGVRAGADDPSPRFPFQPARHWCLFTPSRCCGKSASSRRRLRHHADCSPGSRDASAIKGCHAVLPLLSIILADAWFLGPRDGRSLTVSVLGEDYITFAEAKGLKQRAHKILVP